MIGVKLHIANCLIIHAKKKYNNKKGWEQMAIKDTQVNVKMSEAEKAKIQENAKRLNMDVSEYMRFTAINAEVKAIVKKKD